jgi:hypothetical protein
LNGKGGGRAGVRRLFFAAFGQSLHVDLSFGFIGRCTLTFPLALSGDVMGDPG